MDSNLTERLLKILDWIIEILSFIGLGLIIYLVIKTYPELPDRIPKHWNHKGIVDQWGGKSNFLTLPIVILFIYIIFSASFLSRENVFKLKASIGNKNTRQLKRISGIFKFVLIVYFLLMIYEQSMNHVGKEPLIEGSNILILLLIILAFCGLILSIAFKKKQ